MGSFPPPPHHSPYFCCTCARSAFFLFAYCYHVRNVFAVPAHRSRTIDLWLGRKKSNGEKKRRMWKTNFTTFTSNLPIIGRRPQHVSRTSVSMRGSSFKIRNKMVAVYSYGARVEINLFDRDDYLQLGVRTSIQATKQKPCKKSHAFLNHPPHNILKPPSLPDNTRIRTVLPSPRV